MANPITWRSLMSGNYAAGAVPLAQAQKSFNSAFEGLGGMLKEREAMDARNVGVEQEALTQNFLSKVSAAATPEQLAALQASGELAALQQGMGTKALAATRGVEENRLGVVRDLITKEHAFKTAEQDRAEAPLVDLVKGLVTQKKYDAANQVLGTRDMRNEAPLYAAIEAAQRGDKEFGFKEADQAHQAALRPGQIEDQRLGHESKRSSIATAAVQRAAASAQLQMTREAMADTAANRAIDNNVAAFAAEHQRTTNNMRNAVESEAKSFFPGGVVPMKDGKMDITQMDKPTRDAFNRHLNGKGLPQLDDAYGGDTRAMEAHVLKLRESGATPAQVARAMQQLPGALSTVPMAPIGTEAAAAALKARDQEVAAQDLKDKYGGISTNAPEEQRVWWQAAQEIIKEAPKNDVRNFNEAVTQYAKEGGIALPDGTKIFMGPEKLQELLRTNLGTKWGWGRYTSTSDIYDTLKKWDEENAEGAAKLLNERGAARLRGAIPGSTQSVSAAPDKKKK